MNAASTIYTPGNTRSLTIGVVDDVDLAIQMIFDAFEDTPLYDEAILHAKEHAAQSCSGEQKDRTLEIIDQLGRVMDREYWSARTPYTFSAARTPNNS